MLPKLNEVLTITTDSANHPGEYKARVLDVDDKHIWIEIPLNAETGRYGIFVTKELLHIRYAFQEGLACQFMSNIVARKEDGVRMFGLKQPQPEDIRKSHQRTFLRVQAALEMAIRTSEGHKLLAVTDDISGGGLSFIPQKNDVLHEKQQIQCWMVIPFRNGEYEHIPFVADIVRIVDHKENAAKKVVMVKFHQINANDQQKIIRFCFERQIVQRR